MENFDLAGCFYERGCLWVPPCTGQKHTSFKMDCCFTPSDGYVVGSSEDGQVFYWELVEGDVVDSFQVR